MRTTARARRAAARAAAAAALVLASAPAVAQQGGAEGAGARDGTAVLHGRIAITGTGEPLAGAVVHVPGRDLHVVADSSGRYRITGLAPGEVTVEASYLGARTSGRTVTLEADAARRVDFDAEEAAVELSELRVEVRKRQRGKMAGFEERRKMGLGDYVTRDDIERTNPIRTTQLIRHASPSARIEYVGPGEYRVMLGAGAGGCPPAVHLDGALMANFAVNDIDPADIEAIEIYEGAETPARFRGLQGCGVVLIWTRTGS